MDEKFVFSETKEHGCNLRIDDVELADEFDDFITEECYVFTEFRSETDCMYFYFGQASCIEKVRNLVERFVSRL